MILIDVKSNFILGRVEWIIFDLFVIWKIFVYRIDILLIYLYGVFVIIIILKEVDVDDDDWNVLWFVIFVVWCIGFFIVGLKGFWMI